MIKAIFWSLVAIDALGIGTLFLLGLAAAGSSRTNPLQVALLLLVLPCIPLALSIFLFVRTSSPGLRVLALLIAATPLLLIVSARTIAEVQLRANMNEKGELTFFRPGPGRELAEAIARNDTGAVARLVKTVDVNKSGMSGVTPLILALRQLRETPKEQEVVRLLLAAGADPNVGAQYEHPITIALQVAKETGPGPIKLLLDARADPNLETSFGDPVWFLATGKSSTPEILTMFLDRGANMNAIGKNGATALFSAANSRNWQAALLLLQRGADPSLGRAVNGMPFKEWVESSAGLDGTDSTYIAVRQHLQQR